MSFSLILFIEKVCAANAEHGHHHNHSGEEEIIEERETSNQVALLEGE